MRNTTPKSLLAIVAIAGILLTGCTETREAWVPGPGPGGVGDTHHPQPDPPGPIGIMKAKLAHAQAVLEGIVTEDMDQVQRNARHLKLLSEQAEFQVHRTMEYTVFSNEFRRVADQMAKNAADKNAHAVTLDYLQLVMTCTKCHSHMRWQGLAAIDERDLWPFTNTFPAPDGS